ncbi:MAG TPA: valine--tRNA ligase [Terriglobales bacterium]|nr:valine--tRNA ligase [Terriglobales bacterium]
MYNELDKAYTPQAIEPKWATAWVEAQLFRAKAEKAAAGNWSLVIPPPNVTGSLHMGHMLEHTLIDIMVRWQRMQGKNVLWLPGTDHAGIATQMVVERELAREGKTRQAMGREAFVEAVWAWKRQSGDRIKEQMTRLGASCDWSRARFTLDEGLSRAVREVFVTLYEQGLIYRGRYIVNWCPRCQTAVSDLEVTHEAVEGKLYSVRYAIAGEDGKFLTVATTRPETILADVAVAVNPRDERYQHLIGREVEVPLTKRLVKVIADEIAQPEFGTGAVKITPGHDANDFAAGKRHGLEQLIVIDERGQMTHDAGAYAGLDRFAARPRVVEDLERLGLLAGIAAHPMSVGQCQRCATVIEPRISNQWFVKIAPLAEKAVAVVERGEIRFTPENNQRIYNEWMANIHDWCISRQLWWGHQIPAWYCERCQEVIVARGAPDKCPCGGAVRQDADVLDTWFSSGLWPFSTLGWPEKTPELEAFYPTSLLITGFDILFFWVARMIMLGTHFMGEVPFREVYIHALVRDADKQKMSKTKGNVIDPLVVTEKYGTDAVRFTLAAMAAPGTDIALSEERMQGYAAFANKIWNAARFIFLQLERAGIAPGAQPRPESVVDRWIFSRLEAVATAMDQSLREYRFHEAADLLYQFFWREFCDWYLELSKLGEPSGSLWAAFERALRLLHPVMPFVTEELWHRLYAGEAPEASIALAAFPSPGGQRDMEAEAEIGRLQEVVTALRKLRADAKLAPKQTAGLKVAGQGGKLEWTMVEALARVSALERVETIAANAPLRATAGGYELQLDLGGAFDAGAERDRLRKEATVLTQGVANLRAKLESASFKSKAPPAVVEETERLLAERQRQLTQAQAALDGLTGSGSAG